MMWRNLALEKKVVKKMRTDVHSYDGTGLMNEADQRLWRAFVEKEERTIGLPPNSSGTEREDAVDTSRRAHQ